MFLKRLNIRNSKILCKKQKQIFLFCFGNRFWIVKIYKKLLTLNTAKDIKFLNWFIRIIYRYLQIWKSKKDQKKAFFDSCLYRTEDSLKDKAYQNKKKSTT